MRIHFVIAWVFLLASSVVAQSTTAPTTQETRTGRFNATWQMPAGTDYIRLIAPIAKKFNTPFFGKDFVELRATTVTQDGRAHPPAPGSGNPNPADQDYSVYVPNDYKPDGDAYGLFVWLTPGDRPAAPFDYLPVLDAQKLIFIAPHEVGNNTHPVWRVFMALESVRQGKARFNIDLDRIYVSGVSGGGRMSSIAATFYPDVFSGAFCMCGVNFYKDIPVPNNKYWPGFWPTPDQKLLGKARSDLRYVLLTGTNDMNLENTKGVYDNYVKDKFAHVSYLEVPGMGHQPADGEWFNKGINLLDQPLLNGSGDRFNEAMQLEKNKKFGEAMLAFESAARHSAGRSFADEARQHGKDLRDRYQQQVAQIQTFIQKHQTHEAAVAIQKLHTDFGAFAMPQIAIFQDQMKRANSAQ